MYCSKCHQAIISGEGFAFICFSIGGNAGYRIFHHRYRAGDCWEAYLMEGKAE